MGGLFPDTSPTLIRDLRDRKNATAWNQFDAAYGPGIVRACQAAGLDHSTAKDISQDVLLKVATRLEQYDPARHFRPWLNEVIRHTLHDHRKSAWVKKARLESDGDDAAWLGNLAQSIADALDSEDRLAIHVAIDRVRAEVRDIDWQVFHKRYVEDKSVEDVATELKITTANVKVTAKRFRDQVKELLAGMSPAA
jgi:RNA polymerase sigma-70 factor (ECF subfamily)